MTELERESVDRRRTVIVLLLSLLIGIIAANWLVLSWPELREAINFEGDWVPVDDRFDGLAAGVVPARSAVPVRKIGRMAIGWQRVTLKNPGNVPLQFRAATMRSDGLQVGMRPSTVTVPAGAMRKAWLWVAGRPPSPSQDVKFPVSASGHRDGGGARLKLVLPINLQVVAVN